ncbi:MAG TPA: VWA domain-containing protein [Opitutaceae bacterium]|nr:VWA domain-containing protein [Opitutaceae bacterium]
MIFAWAHLLWLLALPVALLAWELIWRRRIGQTEARAKILHGEAGARQVALDTRDTAATPRTRVHVWLHVGLALAIVALARPQWGRVEEQVFDQSREILLALDLSRSMQAQDVKPSRLERSKLLIQALLERLEGERVGLLVFSGTAFLQSPLSADYEILREFLPMLGPDYLPEGGTNYAALLQTSIEAFASTNSADRFLIILSDGEATDDDWKPLIPDLKAKGIRVIGLGVGTEAGAMIPDSAGGLVKDERGAVVLSKLESGTLEKLAAETGGTYRDASKWIDLAAVLQQTVEAGRKGAFVEKRAARHIDRFQWVLAPAVLCLLLSFWREFPVRPRPRSLALAMESGNRKAETGKTLPAAAFLLLGFLSALRSPLSALAAEDTDVYAAPLAKTVQRLAAQEHYAANDWAELARQTITWGQRQQEAKQPVTEGPVRDGLAAVSAGEKLDAKAADWEQVRHDLEALLQKSEQQQQQQQQQKQPQKNQSDQNQQPQSQQQQQQQQSQDKSGSEQNPPPPKPSDAPKPESAFGDLQKESKPNEPPPSSEMQKVGGAEKKEPPKNLDPTLTLPLQKLEQVKNNDSPARLFQIMEGEKKPTPAKQGKDW